MVKTARPLTVLKQRKRTFVQIINRSRFAPHDDHKPKIGLISAGWEGRSSRRYDNDPTWSLASARWRLPVSVD